MTSVSRERIFDFICRFFDQHGHAPTYYEIADEFGFSHVAASKQVGLLERDGRISRSRGKHRSIHIPGRVDLRPVPTPALQAELERRGGQVSA